MSITISSDGRRYVIGIPDRQLWLINALAPGSRIYYQFGPRAYASVFIISGNQIVKYALLYFGDDYYELGFVKDIAKLAANVTKTLWKMGYGFDGAEQNEIAMAETGQGSIIFQEFQIR